MVNEQARERILQKPRPELGDFLAEEDPLGVLWPVIIDIVYPKPACRERVEGLGRAARVIYLVQCVDREVFNGGFDQYFSNSSGARAHEAQSALVEVGAAQRARLLGLAIGAFAGGCVPTDRAERNDELDDVDRGRPMFLDGLDTEYYALERGVPAAEGLERLLLAFMALNAKETVSATE